MKKLVILQIGLAIVAFIIVAWIFFKERPQAEVNHQLEQQLSQVQQQNQQLTQTVNPTQNDLRQSRAYLREGVALAHKQKYEEAIGQYDKALESFPDDPYGLSLKGYALFRTGRLPESIEANKRAVQLDPGDPLNFIDLAKSYCAAKQYENAEHALLVDPPSDTASDVSHYVMTDGELRRICKPILAHISKSSGPTGKDKSDN
jgi:tetratricopeptide (TPR) repeat protein